MPWFLFAPVAKQGVKRDPFEDQDVQRALQQINLFAPRSLLACLVFRGHGRAVIPIDRRQAQDVDKDGMSGLGNSPVVVIDFRAFHGVISSFLASRSRSSKRSHL